MCTAISSCGQVRISGVLLLPWLSTASCRPRKLEAQFIARYSMSSDFITSTMKSPPLDDWVTGSFSGALVSTAIWRGPGGSALRLARGAVAWACAATGAAIVAAVAAPASVAPFRKLRRLASSDAERRLDMRFLPVTDAGHPGGVRVAWARLSRPAVRRSRRCERMHGWDAP